MPIVDSTTRAAMVHAGLMLAAMLAARALDALGPLALLGLVSLARWVWRVHRAPGSAAALGLANVITALRVALTAALAWVAPWSSAGAGAGVLVVFGLDGLDGWWARRTGTTSRFGAAFDQEADAFLVAMASTAAVQLGVAPGWVLVTGALRYGYVLVVHALGLRGEAPRSTLARYVFGVLVTTLSVALLWPHPATRGALMLASGLLVGSFGRSLWWSWRGPVDADPSQ